MDNLEIVMSLQLNQKDIPSSYEGDYIKRMETICIRDREYYSISIQKSDTLILYVESGSGILYVDYKCHILAEKSTIIIRNNSYAVFSSDCCQFTYVIVEGQIPNMTMDDANLEITFHKKAEFFISSVKSSFLKYKSLDFYSLVSSLYRFYSDFMHAYFLLDENQNGINIVRKIQLYIEHNFQRNLKLDHLAKEIGYSKYYLAHIFKKETGLSIHDYILKRRLTNVKQLLIQDKLTIEEIALQSGFISDVALYRAFKRNYSVTPKQFKKVHYSNLSKEEEERKNGRK